MPKSDVALSLTKVGFDGLIRRLCVYKTAGVEYEKIMNELLPYSQTLQITSKSGSDAFKDVNEQLISHLKRQLVAVALQENKLFRSVYDFSQHTEIYHHRKQKCWLIFIQNCDMDSSLIFRVIKETLQTLSPREYQLTTSSNQNGVHPQESGEFDSPFNVRVAIRKVIEFDNYGELADFPVDRITKLKR